MRARLATGTALAGVIGLAIAFGGPALAADPPASPPAADQPPVQTAPDNQAQVTKETPPSGQAAGSATNVEGVTIVGSHIRRDNFSSPSPVDVITHDETTIAGFASTNELLQSNAVTTGTAQINNAFGGFVVNGGGGVNTLGLRGLGPNRTLILLNGRRITPAGSRGAVGAADLNVLPDAIVDHIEVLKDGASSIYGSDAVAGVVNIVTKQNIEGVTLEAYGNFPYGWAGNEARASVVGGIREDRWQFSGSFEAYHRDDLKLSQRDWTLCNTSFTFNPDGSSADFIDPRTGHPKCYPIDGTGDNGVTINTLGTPATGGLGPPPPVGAPGAPVRSNYNRWRPNASVTTGLVGFEGVSGGSLDVRDTFDPRMLDQSIISPTTNYHLFLQGSYDLQRWGDSQLYFEFLGSNRISSQALYRQLTVDYPRFPGACTPNVSSDNPLLPLNIGCFSANFLAAGGSTITSGLPTAVRAFIGFGNTRFAQDEWYYKTVGGIRGNFALPGWKYDVGVWYARSDTSYGQQTFLTDKLSETLAVVPAPAGFDSTLVRPGAQPGVNLTCAINISNPAARCIPAPVLTADVIGGTLPADWVHYFLKNVVGDTVYDETAVTAEFDGPVFHLPYGDVKAAVGAEFRTDYLNDTPPIEAQRGDLYNLTSAAITRGSDNVWEGYGELEIPILKDVPFAHELTLNGSVRYTSYRSYGGGTTYKVTGLWSPHEWISFRATYGTSFRAPALFEQFLGATSGFLSNQTDPCNNYGALNPTTNRFKNCNAEITSLPNLNNNPPGTFQQNNGITVLTAGGSSLGLHAETSKNFTGGFIFEPRFGDFWGDLSLSVDYFSIEVNNSVDRVGATNLLGLCYDSAGFRSAGSFCSFIDPRNPNTGALTVHDSYTNIATEIVRGIDYNLRYVRRMPWDSKLTINAQITQYLAQDNKVLPTDALQHLNGTIGEPAYAGTLEAIWEVHDWRFRYGLNWVSATNSYNQVFCDPTQPPKLCGANFANTGFVFFTPNYYTHDFSIQYTHDTWQLTVGVHNFTDAKPPHISFGFFDRVGNAPLYSGYDYVGRAFFVDLTKKFQ